MPVFSERTGFDDPNDPVEREAVRGIDDLERYLGGVAQIETMTSGWEMLAQPEAPRVDPGQVAYDGFLQQVSRQYDERAEYHNKFDPLAGNHYLG